jgi:hypothetical protein
LQGFRSGEMRPYRGTPCFLNKLLNWT